MNPFHEMILKPHQVFFKRLLDITTLHSRADIEFSCFRILVNHSSYQHQLLRPTRSKKNRKKRETFYALQAKDHA